jgi:hypothetical protein
MAGKGVPEAAHLESLAEQFKIAYALYLKRNWKLAKTKFTAILKEFPDDQPSIIYSERCDNFIINEPDASWSGISKLFEK